MSTLDTIKKSINDFNKMTIIHIPKIKIESDYALDQYNIRMNKLKYQEFISKKKKEVKKERDINQFDSGEDLMRVYERNRYLRKWNKLDEYAKKMKLREYLEKWLSDNKNVEYTIDELIKRYNEDIKMIKVIYNENCGYIEKLEKWII
jgi:LPS O-antigen subunit length determinant protein (WzzB/FepE family)